MRSQLTGRDPRRDAQKLQALATEHYANLRRATRRPRYLTAVLLRSERDLWLPLTGAAKEPSGFADRIHWVARSAALVNKVSVPAELTEATDLNRLRLVLGQLGWAWERWRVHRQAGSPTSSWQVSYNLGCLYAREKAADTALDWLETALARPGAQQMTVDWLRKDPDLAGLQQHPRFQTLCRSLTTAEDVHA
jgi:hypothetical protein